MSFFKSGEQEGKTGLVWGLVPVGVERIKGGLIWWKDYVLRYENRTMRPVETVPRMGGGVIKENDRGSEFN
jgi:hypothetical protein